MQRMKEVDEDKDGIVTLQEFISFFLNQYRAQQQKMKRKSMRRLLVKDGVHGIRKIDLMERIIFGIKNLVPVDESEDIGENQQGTDFCSNIITFLINIAVILHFWDSRINMFS